MMRVGRSTTLKAELQCVLFRTNRGTARGLPSLSVKNAGYSFAVASILC